MSDAQWVLQFIGNEEEGSQNFDYITATIHKVDDL